MSAGQPSISKPNSRALAAFVMSVASVRHLERQVNVEPEEPESDARTGFFCPNGASVLVLLDVAAFVDHGSVPKGSSGLLI